RDVLRVTKFGPVVLAYEIPCGAPGDTVAEQTDLRLGRAIVDGEGILLVPGTGTDLGEEKLEKIREYAVGRDKGVAGCHDKVAGSDEQQRRSVDSVSHWRQATPTARHHLFAGAFCW